MIAPLRARHRWMIAVIAVLLSIGFAAAIAGRDDERDLARLPDALRDEGPSLGDVMSIASVLHDGRAFTVTRGTVRDVVAVRQESGEPVPSLLAYWSAASSVADELPGDAVVLGAVAAREHRFRVPREGGSVVLFSLAHGEVLASIALAESP
jgi:hypothetical protein